MDPVLLKKHFANYAVLSDLILKKLNILDAYVDVFSFRFDPFLPPEGRSLSLHLVPRIYSRCFHRKIIWINLLHTTSTLVVLPDTNTKGTLLD